MSALKSTIKTAQFVPDKSTRKHSRDEWSFAFADDITAYMGSIKLTLRRGQRQKLKEATRQDRKRNKLDALNDML